MPRFPLFSVLILSLLAVPVAATAGDVSGLRLETVATGLDDPVAVTHADGERLFVTLQDGRIVIVDGGVVLPVPFLDIRDRVRSGGEQGLLSAAFHPGFSANGRFYVNYTDLAGDTVISRFETSGDPDRAEASSEAVLLRIGQPFDNHNGGQLQFGPDGMLYAATGDGGSGFDPLCLAQDGSSLLGKMLRLDVDQNVDQPPHFAVPADNPFVGPGAPADEIWALGLRNPWRFSFDRLTGDLYLGDVGQNQREEVNRQPAASAGGENYGWKMMEGTVCLASSEGCAAPIPGCDDPAYTAPIFDYDHGGGRCSITGGFVYRGGALPELAGAYLYGDFCAGTLWAARQESGGWQSEQLPVEAPGVTSFGEDAAGELYLTAGDTLYRFAGAEPSPCVAGPNTLCLNDGRFRVEVAWLTFDGVSGLGRAETLSADSGYFWFFDPSNPEVFVKVLDACVDPFFHFWVFAAGLTDVETSLTVLDTESGQLKRYDKPLGAGFDPIRDTSAFATCP